MVDAGRVIFQVGIDRASVDRATAELERRLAAAGDINLRLPDTSGISQQLSSIESARIDIDTGQAEARIGAIEQALAALTNTQADRSLSSVENALRGTEQAAQSARGPLNQVDGVLQTFRGAASFVALDRLVDLFGDLTQRAIEFVGASIDVNRELRATENALGIVLGSQQAAAESIDFLREVSVQTGQSFRSLQGEYAGITAAAAEAGVPQEEINELFAETSRVLAVFGRDSTSASLAFNALQQITSIGVVSMEELRQQLGQQLPVALGATARGLGITTGELDALVSSGDLTAAEFIPAFTAGLREIEGAAPPAQQALAALDNAFFEFQQTIGAALEPLETTFSEVFGQLLTNIDVSSLDGFTEAGERLRDAFRENPEVIEAFADAISGVLDVVVGGAATALESFADSIENLDPSQIREFGTGLEQFAANAMTLIGDLATLGSAILELGGNISEGAVDAFNDLTPAISTAIDILGAIVDIISPLTENTELLSAALQTLIARFVAIRAISVAQALGGLATALGTTAAASVTAAGGLGAFAASAALAAAPIVALAAAIGTVGLIRFTQELRVVSDELDAFNNGAQVSGDATLQIANRINNLTDEIASSGGDATAEQAQRLQEFRRIAEAQIEDLQRQLQELNSVMPENAAQASSQQAIEQNLEASIRALESQSEDAANVLRENFTEAAEESADAEVRASRRAAAERTRANAEAVEEFRRSNEEAIAAVELAQSNRIAGVRENQIAGNITQDEADSQIADIESDVIRERLSLREDEISQIQQLEAQGALSAEEAAEQIQAARQQTADLTVQALEQEIAAQERARQAALDRLSAESQLNRLRADQVNIQADLAGTALEDQSNLIAAQVSLEQSRLSLSRQTLDARLAEAQAAEDLVGVEAARDSILINQRQSIAAEFNARRQQLQIQQQLSQLDADRQLRLSEIAQLEAQIAVERAQIEGSSAEEINALQDIVNLREQETEALANQANNAQNILTLQFEQLDAEEQLASQRASQERREQAIEAFREQQRDLARDQLDAERDLANATERRQRATDSIVSSLSNLQDVSADDALSQLDQLEENLRTARRAGAIDGDQSRELQNAIDQAQRFSRGGFDIDEAFRFAQQNADNQFATGILDQIGFGSVTSLLESQQEIAIADSQIEQLTQGLTEVREAIERLPDLIPAGIENMTVVSEAPVADAATIAANINRQQRIARGLV